MANGGYHFTMTKQEQFFYDHAGYSYNPATETPEQGRESGAKRLAQAEAFAHEHDWYAYWMDDPEGCIGCECGSPDCDCDSGEPHETLGCVLFAEEPTEYSRSGFPKGEQLASLWGICGATREYKRVVEAELALEAMGAWEGEQAAERMERECYAL